jgi:hypothetical protein
MSKRSRRRHSSMRDMFDAGDDLGPSPFEGVELEDQPFEDDDDEVDEEAPRVVLGTLEDFGTQAPESVARLGDRPMWFISDAHAEMVGVFERYPEEPASGETTAVLNFLRAYSTSHGAEIQALLGPTDRMRYGFHTKASLGEVVESFEDDGFDVLLGITDGCVELPDE